MEKIRKIFGDILSDLDTSDPFLLAIVGTIGLFVVGLIGAILVFALPIVLVGGVGYAIYYFGFRDGADKTDDFDYENSGLGYVVNTIFLIVSVLPGYLVFSFVNMKPVDLGAGPLPPSGTFMFSATIGILVSVAFLVGFKILWANYNPFESEHSIGDLIGSVVFGEPLNSASNERNILAVLDAFGLTTTDSETGEIIPDVEYGFAPDSPPPGQASVDFPLILLIEKHPRLTKKRLTSPEFYQSLAGVRSLLSCQTCEQDNDFWKLELVDIVPGFPDVISLREKYLSGPVGNFPLGLTVRGELVEIDLGKKPNILIAGGSGSGKTILMNQLIYLCYYKNIEISMVDPDGQLTSDMSVALENAGLLKNYGQFSDDWLPTLRAFEDEMETRKAPGNYRPHILFTDETARLMEYPANEDILTNLVERARKRRMAVCSVFQNPGAGVLPSRIRDNFMHRVMGQLKNVSQVAQIFPGYSVADAIAQLDGPGEFMIDSEDFDELVRFKGFFHDDWVKNDEGW